MQPLHQQGRQHNLEIATCSAVGDLATLRSKRQQLTIYLQCNLSFLKLRQKKNDSAQLHFKVDMELVA